MQIVVLDALIVSTSIFPKSIVCMISMLDKEYKSALEVVPCSEVLDSKANNKGLALPNAS
jgi:hypothetical protein